MPRCAPKSAAAVATLVAACAALALAPAAEAGTYRVSTCQSNSPPRNESWEADNPGSRPADLRDECGSSTGRLLTRATGHWSAGWAAGWRFTAPEGTTLDSIDYKADGGQNNSAFVPILSTDRAALESCYRLGGCGWSANKRGVSLGGAQYIFAGVYCATGGPSNNCYLDSNPAGHAWMSLYGATVVVEDPSPPAITNRRGYIDSQTTVRGEADVVFDAADNVGIRSARLLVDGRPVDRRDYPCDYAEARPCSDVAGARLAFDSRRWPNGTHVVTLEVYDAAENNTIHTETITVDNPPERRERPGDSSGRGGGGSSGGGSSGGGGGSGSSSGGDGGQLTPAPGHVTMVVRPSRTRNNRSVVFAGRTSPAVARTLVLLQARIGRGWRTFRPVYTDATGRFRSSYRFWRTPRSTRYAFRAVVPFQIGFSGPGGVSRPVWVTVTR